MSRQFLQTHSIQHAHSADIFSLATTSKQVISASGTPDILVHNLTFSPDEPSPYPHAQTLPGVHKLGVHHVCVSRDGLTLASAGFGGEVAIHTLTEDGWTPEGRIIDDIKAGEVWAIALSQNGQYLAGTTADGRVNVWDTQALTTDGGNAVKTQEYQSKGSFGSSVDLSSDGEMTASGHQNGSVHVFNNSTGRLVHSLQGLIGPVRSVAFSPGCSYLAAAGDARVIAIYNVKSGEQVANLSGSGSWIMSLDWNANGEYLLSGAQNGKAKVWSLLRRECVATQTESSDTLWSVKWLPPSPGLKNETFVTAGSHRSISFYREATGT